MQDHPSALVAQLSSAIKTLRTSGEMATVSYQDFIAGLLNLDGISYSFDQAVFTDLGVAGQPELVARTWSAAGSTELGGTVVVAQQSRGFLPSDLRIVEVSSEQNSDYPISSEMRDNGFPRI